MANSRKQFGPFEADVTSRELRRDGQLVPLQDLPFRLLAALLERPGEVVTRAELTAALWGSETFVDATAGLNTAVAKLREALSDDPDRPAYIETAPKRGYRFIAHVEEDARLKPRAPADDATHGVTAIALEREALAERPGRRHLLAWTGAAAVIVLVGAIAAYQLRADRPAVRVAVMLFDNETGKPEFAQLAQSLTDATVTELTAEGRLAVIGNAAVLRTARPFRDIAAVRDALNADFIVIGQVQLRDGDVIVRAHLIRASDQAHVWVDVAQMTGTEAAFQSDVARRIRGALAKHIAS